MATAIQKNGIQPLTNGSIGHDVSNVNSTHEMNPSNFSSSQNVLQPDAQGDVLNENSDAPEIDIVINNVVCSFSVRCHLNLRQIALNGANVEYRRENGVCIYSSHSCFVNCMQFTV